MRRPTALLLPLLAGLLLSGCASLGGLFGERQPAEDKTGTSAPQQPQQRVAYELEIEAPETLRALLQEHLDLARFQRVGENEGLSRVELDRLAAGAPAQARTLLETEGYFNAEIKVERSSGEAERVRLRVTPGPRAQVARLDLGFTGALQEPQQADALRVAEALRLQLQHGFALQPGKPFRQADWSAAKTETLARARAGGYPLARWSLTAARVQAESNQAELELLLDSGPLFRLGELQIEGLKHHDEESIRRVSGLTPGQPFTERALLDFQERILKTQLFDGATVDIQPEADQAEAAPVRVVVREAPLQQATTGIGYDTDKGQRVTLEYLHRRPFGLELRSLSKLNISRELRSASLELTSHPQTDMHQNLGSLGVEQDLRNGVDITSLIGRLGRLRETARDERLDFVELLRSHERFSDNTRLTAGAVSINTNRIWRRVDSLLLPTDGRTAILELGLGRASSSSDENGLFGRVRMKLGWYKPLADNKWFASARLELAQLIVRDAVRVPDRLLFRAGGDESVRGYGPRDLGPPGDAGGRTLFTGSLELARPISAKLPAFWGAAFIDAGQAADRWGGLKPAIGWGFGARWRSPIGPLRLDLARGQETGKWRLHFSVGIVL
ncbi:BamA/TamA family outer membrane protein [Roseateles sp. DAIF2]|uniref:autotransporter assembly complex protein TamA n=1 Tax=Roseateles sp. DAIF2 TaxID=2714952 RepID=UPI0018A2AE18|nr:BamA/TamA family outer membrane protein [Roseateles sp. DAIF2]QPF75034.1 BamA/TamA family outer membrane protein [Roseateles sp. DAIF2]